MLTSMSMIVHNLIVEFHAQQLPCRLHEHLGPSVGDTLQPVIFLLAGAIYFVVSRLTKFGVLACHWQDLQAKMNRTSKVVRLLSGTHETLTSVALLVLILKCCFSIPWYSGLALAKGCAESGQMLAAEYIYKAIPDPSRIKGRTALCTQWSWSCDRYWGKQFDENDKIVRLVYGEGSAHVAYRQVELGDANRLLAMGKYFRDDLNGARQATHHAVGNYKKALPFYGQQHDDQSCARIAAELVECLTMDVCQFGPDHPEKSKIIRVNRRILSAEVKAEAVRWLTAGLQYLMNVKPVARNENIFLSSLCAPFDAYSVENYSTDDRCIAFTLERKAGTLGEYETEKAVTERSEAMVRDRMRCHQERLKTAAREVDPALAVVPALVFAIVFLPIEALYFRRRWETELVSTHDFAMQIDLLNNLITIALVTFDVAAADRFSRELLEVAERH